MMKTTVRFIVVFSFIVSCAPSRFVKPLKEGQKAISASYGGALITYGGLPVPLPFTTVAFGYGIKEKLTAFGSLHTTSLLFGNLQSDIGTTIGIVNGKKTGISFTPSLQLAYNLRHTTGFRLWPSTALNTWMHFNSKPSYLYAGIDSWYELSRTSAHNEPRARFIVPNLHLGYTIVKEKWQHQFQAGYLGVGIPNLPNVAEYIGPGGRGSFAFHYNLIRTF